MATRLTIEINADIQGADREQLWRVCCSSYPAIQMSEFSDIDSYQWELERGTGTSTEAYRAERETLGECIYNLGYVIEGSDSNEWMVE